MYSVMIIFLAATSALLVLGGYKRKQKPLIVLGGLLAVGSLVFFSLLDIWGELLWFKALGYPARFWKVLFSQIVLAVVGGSLGFGFVWLLLRHQAKTNVWPRRAAQIVGTLIGLTWGPANWDLVLKFFNRVTADVSDPILGRDVGFYLFHLPLFNSVYGLLFSVTLVSLLAAAFGLFFRVTKERIELRNGVDLLESGRADWRPLYSTLAALLLVGSVGWWLERYQLLFSDLGAVTGPGWTDVHLRLPAYTILSLVSGICGILLLVPPARRTMARLIAGKKKRSRFADVIPAVAPLALILVLWFLAVKILPRTLQALVVEPNEISLEKPYIANNIEFTRKAFKLGAIEEREFKASEEFTSQMVKNHPNVFNNIRLWDWRALDAVYKQFQEIRLYYEFVNLDLDRYMIGEDYRQVMISAREMEQGNLPAKSQTFVNTRFKYTHGFGVAMNTVSDFTPEGLPNLLIKDIPPVASQPDLKVTQPRIYYGELTREHVIVNTSEKEFDHPKGDENAYTRYSGQGGVEISSFFRKLLFGWKFDGTPLLLSGYPTPESRIMFHREIQERLKTLAPFIQFDQDPYLVLSEGRLFWIVDGYTATINYPYSRSYGSRDLTGGRIPSNPAQRGPGRTHNRFAQINYLRNSVKAVVDAYQGSVDLYIFEPQDPLIRVWDKIFPGLFRPAEDMPGDLRRHIRYPVDMLLTQGLVYAKYHMTDPAVFYNQEDLWVRATEKYYGQVKEVEPYYVIWELPKSDEPQFVLILPFTPKNRQVMIGWIAGLCDGDNYGRMLAYKFPKEKRVLGPQQVETKIDQDRHLSSQLTLWDQKGSRVIRGNVLAIPLGQTLFYVEPIYLQAETAAYPELRLVVVMHGDNLSYAPNFEEALEGLFEGRAPIIKEKEASTPPGARPDSQAELISRAGEAFDAYVQQMGEKSFQSAAGSLEALESLLNRLKENAQETQSSAARTVRPRESE